MGVLRVLSFRRRTSNRNVNCPNIFAFTHESVAQTNELVKEPEPYHIRIFYFNEHSGRYLMFGDSKVTLDIFLRDELANGYVLEEKIDISSWGGGERLRITTVK